MFNKHCLLDCFHISAACACLKWCILAECAGESEVVTLYFS